MTQARTAIIGVGMTEIGEHWATSLRELAADAAIAALNDASIQKPDAIFVANAYGSTFNHQTQLGAVVADYLGFGGVEAVTIEAGDASGGAALRAAHLAVLSGQVRHALVVGVEKVTDIVGAERVRARTISLDADFEAAHGATLTSMAALLMRRYMHDYQLDISVFEPFSINAHVNGKRNPRAMYRNTLRQGAFNNAPMIADPVSLFDSAPDADGAAAVVITQASVAQDLVPTPIFIDASVATTDTLKLQDRLDLLWFNSVALGVNQALAHSGYSHNDIDLFELHDAFTVMSVLALEAAGFTEKGKGWSLGQEIGLQGRLPLSTFGGLKSRGNPAGATGVCQAVEAALQLRGQAGDNQVADAEVAMIQSLGGLASTAVTHILSKRPE